MLQVLSTDLATFTVSSQEEAGTSTPAPWKTCNCDYCPFQPFTVPVVLSQRLSIYGQGQIIRLEVAVKVTESLKAVHIKECYPS